MTRIQRIHSLGRPPLFRAACLDTVCRSQLSDDVFWELLVKHGRGVYSATWANVTSTEALLFRALAIETIRWSRPPHPQDIRQFRGECTETVMRSFTIAKTAVDFIRLRNRIGQIRAYTIVDLMLRWNKLTVAELIACAERNRATHPVREYLARRATER